MIKFYIFILSSDIIFRGVLGTENVTREDEQIKPLKVEENMKESNNNDTTTVTVLSPV